MTRQGLINYIAHLKNELEIAEIELAEKEHELSLEIAMSSRD